MASPPFASDAGEAYVVSGPLVPGVFDLSQIIDVTIRGSVAGLGLGSGLATGDLDGDGTAEDLNGNGRLDFDDVVTLFEYFNSPTVQDNQAVFDYNGNGRVDMDDVIALFDMLIN